MASRALSQRCLMRPPCRCLTRILGRSLDKIHGTRLEEERWALNPPCLVRVRARQWDQRNGTTCDIGPLSCLSTAWSNSCHIRGTYDNPRWASRIVAGLFNGSPNDHGTNDSTTGYDVTHGTVLMPGIRMDDASRNGSTTYYPVWSMSWSTTQWVHGTPHASNTVYGLSHYALVHIPLGMASPSNAPGTSIQPPDSTDSTTADPGTTSHVRDW